MADFIVKPDKYRILSLVEDPRPPTGITDHGLEFAPVRLNQPEQIWEIAPGPDGSFYFSIGRFPYTGIDVPEREAVIATLDANKNVPWYITRAESQDAYIITVDPEGTRGWTIDGVNEGVLKSPDSLIVIQPITFITTNPPANLPYQLFKFELVPE